MKLKAPLKIDIFQFITTGVFDCIKPGQYKQYLIDNFPDPDDEFITANGMSIWSYGNMELHFDENGMLFLIWCDRFQSFNGGPSIHFEPWLIRWPDPPRLPEVIDVLTQNRGSFTLAFNKTTGSANIRVLKSNVDLHFEPNSAFEDAVGYGSAEYNSCGYQEFELLGIGLSHETHRMKLS